MDHHCHGSWRFPEDFYHQFWDATGGATVSPCCKSEGIGLEDIPLGLALYPAVSLKGRASFCFGTLAEIPSALQPPSRRFPLWLPNGPQRDCLLCLSDCFCNSSHLFSIQNFEILTIESRSRLVELEEQRIYIYIYCIHMIGRPNPNRTFLRCSVP